MAEPVHTLDHAAQMLARLAQQYKDDAGFEAILNAHGEQIQALEDALMGVYSGYLLDTATLAQLDVFGRLVGQARDGASDTEYRPRIRARIRALLSAGTVEELYAVLVALFSNATAGTFEHEYEGPQGQTLTIHGETTSAALAAVATALIGRARAAVERTILVWRQGLAEDTLTFPVSTNFAFAYGLNPGTRQVFSTTGFPTAGTVKIAAGVAAEENMTYTGKTATTFTGCSATANFHDQYATCELVTGAVGEGLDDVSTYQAGASLALDTSVVTIDASLFPSSGSFVFDPGTPLEETVTYTGKAGAVLTGCSPLVYGHADRAQLTLIDSTGGEFAGAVLAE